jgi:hypothetical protein
MPAPGTNVLIDDRLMKAALKTSGCRTQKDVIEEGLKLVVRLNGLRAIRRLRGKMKWDGHLDASWTDA